MQELLLYIMILVVFLLAYGVTTVALQYPTRTSGLSYIRIFRDIFYYPYWQIYGELFLEQLEGSWFCGCIDYQFSRLQIFTGRE